VNFYDSNLFLELKSDLLNFNLKDPLVSIHAQTTILMLENQVEKSSDFIKILKETKKTEREKGVNSLCFSRGIIEIEFGNTITFTPIELFEIEQIKNLSETKIEVSKGVRFSNPYLIHFLNRNYNTQLSFNTDTEELHSKLEKLPFKMNKEIEYLGNFHPFRYELLKEFSEIEKAKSFSNPLNTILGLECEISDTLSLKLPANNLFPVDHWQNSAIKSIQTESLIVQGPPGTGKSQLISNLTGKIIANNNSLLIVSEKQAALEVIKSKFNSVNLDFLCFINSSQKKSKEIIFELKKTWDTFLNRPILLQNKFKSLKPFEDKLNAFISQESLEDFNLKSYLKEQSEITFNETKYISDTPKIEQWKAFQNTFSQLNEIDFKLIKHFRFDNYSNLKIGFNNLVFSINKFLDLGCIHEIKTSNDFIETMKKAAIFQQFSSSIYTKNKHILNQKTNQFVKLRKSYLESKKNINFLNSQTTNWLHKPTLIELDFLNKSFQTNTFLGKIKWKNTWKKWSRSPNSDAQKQLEQMERLLGEELKLYKINKSLFQIGIENEQEIELIYGLLKTFDKKAWEEFINTSETKLEALLKIQSELNDVYQLLKHLFHFSNDTNISSHFSSILEKSERFSFLIELLQGTDIKLINLLKSVSCFEEAKAIVYKSNWINFTLKNPHLIKFDFNKFIAEAEITLLNEEINQNAFAIDLGNKQIQLFQDYQNLMAMPNAKLNANQKELKSKLKLGKAILVKEFGKQRNHLTLRQLFNSEAKYWLRVIKPVWFSNPIAIATLFPAEKEMFDLVIFDEASQIPLSHSIGALHRAKRVLIAGDSQQMGPSSYFTRENENITDVLHQASYYYKNITLCGHYRSRHKSLIDFSNLNFYHNQLEVFEDFNTKIKNPISFHFIEKGIYADNKNMLEAKDVAKFIDSQINNEEKIGIVAFSETQLSEIYNLLKAPTKILLEDRIENNSAFFKALEQVQGDECDHLIVSFGYGYNPDGKFDMRFGPVNRINGEKRLNVLFSRSREQITFFASVKSNDFKHSENRAVQLLKNWFQQIEEERADFTKTNEIFIEDLIFSSKSIADFTTKFKIYKSRNWKINSKYHDFPSRLGTGS
jgi:hypothetical protein